jgi:arylsulfatase
VLFGNLKLVSVKGKPWELFDLANDRSESHDLSSSNSDKVQELSELWTRTAHEFMELAMREPPPADAPRKRAKGAKQ